MNGPFGVPLRNRARTKAGLHSLMQVIITAPFLVRRSGPPGPPGPPSVKVDGSPPICWPLALDITKFSDSLLHIGSGTARLVEVMIGPTKGRIGSLSFNINYQR